MKKFFTLILLSVLTVSANAAINIYVQCEQAPYIWWWGQTPAGSIADLDGKNWPGTYVFTETYTHPDTGESFWKYTFPEEVKSISFCLNNGMPGDDCRQTTDINAVTSDRYFVLGKWSEDGSKITPTDVTEDYAEVPDATITSCGISGNHNDWADAAISAVEAGKSYSFTATPTSVGTTEWQFKFRPNGQWIGYGDVAYDGGAAPEWLTNADGNFAVNFSESNIKSVTFTLTWGGGKDATKNWTLKAEAEFNEGEAPDAVITACGISGNHNGWALPDGSALTVVEDGKTYSFTAAAADITLPGDANNVWQFKFRPNNDAWLGYADFAYDGGEAPAWLTNADGNFGINFTESNITSVTFTLTWGGGKSASKNWTLKAEATIATGISSVKSSTVNTAAMFNLQGQRVQQGFRGIAVVGGRKVMVK